MSATVEHETINRNKLRAYNKDLQDLLVQAVNHDGCFYRLAQNKVILYPLDASKPISIFARNDARQVGRVREFYDQHVRPIAHPEPVEDEPVEPPVEVHVPPVVVAPPVEPVPLEEAPLDKSGPWHAYVHGDGTISETIQANERDVYRCMVCPDEESRYYTAWVRGIHTHVRLGHGDTGNLYTPETITKRTDSLRFNRLNAKVQQAIALLCEASGVPVPQTEIEALRAERDELKTRLALIEEAMRV